MGLDKRKGKTRAEEAADLKEDGPKRLKTLVVEEV